MSKLVEHATYSQGRATRSRGRTARATNDQIAAWQAFVRAFLAATRAHEAALRCSELDASDYDVLLTLAEGPPEGLRPTELAQRVLLTKSGITRLVDRLAERGLIERRACPSDRRGQLVALTPKGRRAQRRAAPGLLRSIASSVGALSAADLAAFRHAAERITEATTPHSPE
jgi:DNA-binding MarR family transcriptional regulator